MNCNENNYKLLTTIKAYPDDGITFIEPDATLNKFLKTDQFILGKGDFTSLTSGYVKVPIKPGTANMKEKSVVSVSGESYELTIEWTVKGPTKDDYIRLGELKRERKHLIVKTYDGSGYLLRSYEYAYRFQYQEDDGDLACELTMINLQGAQRIQK